MGLTGVWLRYGTDGHVTGVYSLSGRNPCELGAPLHQMDNSSVLGCGGQFGQCPAGYACRAGQYGELFCCRDRLSQYLFTTDMGGGEGSPIALRLALF